MKILFVGPSCSMRTDRRTDGRTHEQTDMTKLIVAFRNFAKVPKNESNEYQSNISLNILLHFLFCHISTLFSVSENCLWLLFDGWRQKHFRYQTRVARTTVASRALPLA